MKKEKNEKLTQESVKKFNLDQLKIMAYDYSTEFQAKQAELQQSPLVAKVNELNTLINIVNEEIKQRLAVGKV